MKSFQTTRITAFILTIVFHVMASAHPSPSQASSCPSTPSSTWLKRPKTYGPTPVCRLWLTEIYIKKGFTFTRKSLTDCAFSVTLIFPQELRTDSGLQIKIDVKPTTYYTLLALQNNCNCLSYNYFLLRATIVNNMSDGRRTYLRHPSDKENTANPATR